MRTDVEYVDGWFIDKNTGDKILNTIDCPSQWPKIKENIKQERKVGGIIKCNGNGNATINIVGGELDIEKEFPCLGKMIFNLRNRTMKCDICNKILKFHRPDYWKEINNKGDK